MVPTKQTCDLNNVNLNDGRVVDPIKRHSIISKQAKTKDDNPVPIQIDHIIGDFGLYQLAIFLFKISIGATSAFNNLGVSFYAPHDFVSHWCDQSIGAPETTNNFKLGQPMINHRSNISNPIVTNPNNDGYLSLNDILIFDSLNTFITNNDRHERHNSKNFTSMTPKKLRTECNYIKPGNDNDKTACQAYKYDTGIWLNTIIDEWDLVCDRSWLISLTQSLYMSGFILAYPIFGYFSDRYGRRKSIALGSMMEMLAGFGCAFANSITVFMIFRFMIGFGNAGRSSSSYLIMIEWVGPKWRMAISTLGSLGWVFGYIALPWLHLYFLHFRHMQIFVGLYEFLFIVGLVLIPESPRWLLTHRRYNEAREVILRAARFNRLIIPENNAKQGMQLSQNLADQDLIKRNNFDKSQKLSQIENGFDRTTFEDDHCKPEEAEVQPMTLREYNHKFDQLVETIEAKEFTKNEHKLTILDVFKMKNLRKYLLILFFIWATDSFVYYGIVLRVGGDNIFASYTVAAFMEFPSIFFTIVCMKYLPRSKSNYIIFSITAASCLIQLPLKYYNYGFLLQCCIMLAKVSNSCSFTCVLYQTMELFPTSIRQTAYTSCCFAGRIGSILAPFVKELAHVTNESVPALLYASLNIIAACLLSVLPETKGSDLHDTLMEAEKFEGMKSSTDNDLESSSAVSDKQNDTVSIRRRTTSISNGTG